MTSDIDRFHDAVEAMKSADIDRLERLFADGFDPNSKDPTQGLALLIYLLRNVFEHVSQRQVVQLVNVILAAGGDPNVVDGEGRTALFYSRSVEMVDVLSAHGAIMDITAARHLTSLFYGQEKSSRPFSEIWPTCNWEDSVKQTWKRCQSAERDGLSATEVLTQATPFIATEVSRAQANLSRGKTGDGTFPLEKLYAVNRINDLLLNGLMPEACTHADDWVRPDISVAEYRELLAGFGFDLVDFNPYFSPIYHEVVSVGQDPDPNFTPVVEEEYWPATTLDISADVAAPSLMALSRAGVRVRAGERHIKKPIAENSRLFWAYYRSNRDHEDLSHGWGSNSQWATDLKLDVVTNTHHRFNLAIRNQQDPEAVDLAVDDEQTRARCHEDGLTREQAIELVRNRCLISGGAAPNAGSYAYWYFLDVPI